MTPDDEPPQDNTIPPAVENAGEPTIRDGIYTIAPASGPATIPPENLLDQNLDATNVEDALRSRVTISVLASMASLDVVMPGGGNLQGLYDTLFRSKEMNDDFSISNLGGTLEEYFEYKLGEVDANGQKKDDDKQDGWDAYVDNAAERMQHEREMEETFSQHTLDDMAWEGDQNEVWDMGGVSASRSIWYNAAKSVRKNLPALAKENNWSDAERADQEHWLSEFERLTKAGDLEGAERIKEEEFKPETRQAVEYQAQLAIAHDASVSAQTVTNATSVNSNASVSTLAGSAALAEMAGDDDKVQSVVEREKVSASPSLINTAQNIELTEEFAAVAADKTASPAPVQLASSVTMTKPTTSNLNQNFDL